MVSSVSDESSLRVSKDMQGEEVGAWAEDADWETSTPESDCSSGTGDTAQGELWKDRKRGPGQSAVVTGYTTGDKTGIREAGDLGGCGLQEVKSGGKTAGIPSISWLMVSVIKLAPGTNPLQSQFILFFCRVKASTSNNL